VPDEARPDLLPATCSSQDLSTLQLVDPEARALRSENELRIEEPVAVPYSRQEAARDISAQRPDPAVRILETDAKNDPQQQSVGPTDRVARPIPDLRS
jgi:hypothetical protein